MPEDIDTEGIDADAGASVVVKDGQVMGNLEYMADVIQQTVGGDLFRIETVVLQMVRAPSRASLRFCLFSCLPVSSCQGGVLSRRPVAERRHLGRVLCGLMCPLRYAPSESAAAGTTHRLDSGLPGTNELYSQKDHIRSRRTSTLQVCFLSVLFLL